MTAGTPAAEGTPARSRSAATSTVVFRVLAVGLGAIHSGAAMLRQSMNEDGISYMDLGDAILRGDWSTAVNSVWSPLYALILGAALRIADPPLQWQFPAVHLVNFGIYLLALVCFEFFWRELTNAVRRTRREEGLLDLLPFPEWAWVSLGYALFIWSSLAIVEIWSVTPDMLVAALVYLAAGLLIRIGTGEAPLQTYGSYGMVLGLAYLAKAVMFPLAFTLLAAAAVAPRDRRRAMPRVLLAASVFLAISLPFVAVLSSSKDRFTFGEAGRLTYLRYVQAIPYPHWRPGVVPDVSAPEHPPRRIFRDPPVYEFATPVGGTYPLSYDPSYWYEGVGVRFDAPRQLRALASNARFYFDFFFRRQSGVVATVLILYLVGRRSSRTAGSFDARWALTGVALVAFALYALVYVEERYLGPFVVLFWAGVLSHVHLPEGRESRRLGAASGTVLVLLVLLNVAASNMEGASAFLGHVPPLLPEPPTETRAAPGDEGGASCPPRETAERLGESGVRPGDRIGFVGYAFGAYFARLAEVRIIAELPDGAKFWGGDPSMRDAVLRAFATTGADAVVTEGAPARAALEGWNRVGATGCYLYRLR